MGGNRRRNAHNQLNNEIPDKKSLSVLYIHAARHRHDEETISKRRDDLLELNPSVRVAHVLCYTSPYLQKKKELL